MTSRRVLAGVLLAGVCAVAGAALTTACGLEAAILIDPSGIDADATTSDTSIGFPDGSARLLASAIFAGQYFSCALAGERAYCWGSNTLGPLGTGDFRGRLAPTPVATESHFAALALGESHSCGIETTTGRVLCWGASASGQLGLGDTALHAVPQALTMIGPAAQITSGFNHTCAVLRDGSLWCWGDNSESQLGQGPDNIENAPLPLRVEAFSDWRLVSGGQGHTCGIRAPGTLWCWGRNTTGEAGLGMGAPGRLVLPTRVGAFDDWVSVELGQGSACAIRQGGSLWCWGDTGDGVQYTPTRIGSDSDWKSASTDVFTTCGIRAGNSLSCFGRNAEGQLGLGDTTPRPTTPTPTGLGSTWTSVAVGRLHVCALTTEGVVRCAGTNEHGELGVGDADRRFLFTEVAGAVAPPH